MDVVILPSVREQFGQVLVEGMACGLPAIAVNSYGPVEIIDDGQTGWLVPPGDERALAEALLEAVNDDGLRLQRGVDASTAVRARYSWPALGEKLARTYEAVLGRPFFPDAECNSIRSVSSSSIQSLCFPEQTLHQSYQRMVGTGHTSKTWK
jgi:glycogen synthase